MQLLNLWCLAVVLVGACHASADAVNFRNGDDKSGIKQASIASIQSDSTSYTSSASTSPNSTVRATAKAPTVTIGAYSIYWWDCQRETSSSSSNNNNNNDAANSDTAFRAGTARAGACGSRDNVVQGAAGAQQYSICGCTRTLGGSYLDGHGRACSVIAETGGSCCNDAGWDALASCVDTDGTVCKVQKTTTCNDVCNDAEAVWTSSAKETGGG